MSKRKIFADLHIHRNYPGNDSSRSPEEICLLAKHRGIGALTILSHDTMAGVAESEATAKKHGLIFHSGVEISSQAGEHEIHLLGYNIDADSRELSEALAGISCIRLNRIREACKNIARVHDLHIDPEDVFALAAGVPRERLAEIDLTQLLVTQAALKMTLVNAGCLPDPLQMSYRAFRKAYDRVVNANTLPPKKTILLSRSIELVRQAGGKSVAAHLAAKKRPRTMPSKAELYEWRDLGMDGIEVHYPLHDSVMVHELLNIATDCGFIVTGGSDDHGSFKPEGVEMGTVGLTREEYEIFLAALAE
ncbi:hypothetical protein KJ705_04830 [Patescibacteria group bacterium]|nr:hypothetical protein [Patescibacteria group bacterium]